MDVGRHPRGIATDVDRRTRLDPIVQVPPRFGDALLHVGLAPAVTREGEIETSEQALLQRPLPFELVQEIAAESPRTEDEPVASARPGGRALLQESAKRRDT